MQGFSGKYAEKVDFTPEIANFAIFATPFFYYYPGRANAIERLERAGKEHGGDRHSMPGKWTKTTG